MPPATDQCTFTVIALVAVPLYMSTATTEMRCVPALSVSFFASWSDQRSPALCPSIQTSSRSTPAGELPLALISTGEVTLALLAGPQILAARFAELGGAQLVNALVLRLTIVESSLGP